MTVSEAKQEFQAVSAKEGFLDSPSIMLECIKNQIAWLEHVADNEYSKNEKQRLFSVAYKFYGVIRPLTAKYID